MTGESTHFILFLSPKNIQKNLETSFFTVNRKFEVAVVQSNRPLLINYENQYLLQTNFITCCTKEWFQFHSLDFYLKTFWSACLRIEHYLVISLPDSNRLTFVIEITPNQMLSCFAWIFCIMEL